MSYPYPETVYYPEEFELATEGTLDSGDIKVLRDNDDVLLEVSEANATPGFDMVFTFKKMILPKLAKRVIVNIIGWYEGGGAHDVKLKVWNYDTEAWDDVTTDADDFPTDTSKQIYAFEFTPAGGQASYNKLSGATEMKFMIEHETAGSNAHDMYIDQMYLGFTSLEDSPR